ncbi:MAG: TlyA family RNA methyltransferase, partial [Verrucomicrobiota bacterium]
LEGQVLLPDGSPLTKPGKSLAPEIKLVLENPPRFVSRGGEKLAAWLDEHPIDLNGAHILDVGASTGGFTDCALQNGAASATCIDVGHGQLHPKLQDDPRVTNYEGLNARHLQPCELPREHYDAIVMDLSFISLRTVLPAVWPFLKLDGTLIALLKPQFEAGPEITTKTKGVIRDPAVHARVLEEIKAFALAHLQGAQLLGGMPSPVIGGDGNQEFLLGLTKAPA